MSHNTEVTSPAASIAATAEASTEVISMAEAARREAIRASKKAKKAEARRLSGRSSRETISNQARINELYNRVGNDLNYRQPHYSSKADRLLAEYEIECDWEELFARLDGDYDDYDDYYDDDEDEEQQVDGKVERAVFDSEQG